MKNIAFSPEQKQFLTSKLQQYFTDELHHDLGEFDAEFLLDFIGENIGVYFYNQGLRDAQAVLLSKLDDITEAIEEIEQITEFPR